MLTRVQRLEPEQAELRAKIDGDRQLRFLIANITSAALTASEIGAAIERFAEAMRAPLKPGRAGGLARARTAWRYSDGTFVPYSERLAEIEEIERADYERYAAGGRARAARARRSADGTFMRGELEAH